MADDTDDGVRKHPGGGRGPDRHDHPQPPQGPQRAQPRPHPRGQRGSARPGRRRKSEGGGPDRRSPRPAVKHAAREVMLSGAPITARRSYELGLVNKVAPAEMTISIAQRFARQAAEKAPLALRMAKEAVLKAFETPLSEGLAVERKSFYFLFSTEDQKEGMHAFLEKRRGVFKGR